MRAALLSVVAAFTLAAGGALAQSSTPDTESSRLLRQLLDVFNNGTRDARVQFLRERWAYTPNVAFYQDLFEQTGGFELVKVESSTATRTIAIARQIDSDAVSRLTFEVDPEAPGKITRFTAQQIPRPADLAIVRLTESELVKTLGLDLDRRAAGDRFAGTVLVAKNGRPIFTGAYGLADRERKAANTLGTRFKNGSISKMFTAVATLTLVQAGKLALDDPLIKHLPDYPNRTLASKVTIHHLLTHTGGTGDFFGAQYTAHRLELRTHQDFVNLFGPRSLLFEPGSQWAYSNYGFALLGAVIEKVSGQSYYDYVRDHVFVPSGMTSTGSEPEDQLQPNTAVGYMRRQGAWQSNKDTLGYRGMAAGGSHTTVEDLLRFATALTANRLLSPENTQLLTTGKVAANGGRYAYGFGDFVINGLRAFGHSGGAPGQTGDLLIFPESGFVVAVLANMDPPTAPRVSNFIANRLPTH